MLTEQHKTLKALPANCDSGAPSSVSSDSSTGSADEETNHNEDVKNTLKNDIVMPEIVPEYSGNVSIVVGNQKYKIVLANSEFCIKPKEQHEKDGTSQPIFDPDVHKDSGGKGIPIVKPVFLGDEGANAISKSIYDDINSYLGNDPMLIRSVNTHGRASTSQMSHFSGGMPDAPISNSALSNLHAMIQNSCYSSGSSQPQLNPQLNKQQRPNFEVGHAEPGHNSNHSTWHQISGSDQPSAINYGNYHQNDNRSSYYAIQNNGTNSHKTSGITSNEHYLVHVPSTSTRHNPTLVQLLNTKASRKSHIRETLTSHLVTDSSGVNGDKASK